MTHIQIMHHMYFMVAMIVDGLCTCLSWHQKSSLFQVRKQAGHRLYQTLAEQIESL